LLARLRLTTPTGVPLLAETTNTIGAYLTAERGLGRIAIDTDVDTLAVILVGTTYLLATGSGRVPIEPDDLYEAVSTTIESVTHKPPAREPTATRRR